MLRLPYSRSVLLRLWSFLRSAALPVGCPTVAFAIAVRLDTAPVALFVMLALGINVTQPPQPPAFFEGYEPAFSVPAD